jgi:hypothetical protein
MGMSRGFFSWEVCLMDDGRAPLEIPSFFFTDRSSDAKQDLSSRGEDAVLRYSVRNCT